jgi:hypothetical protein
LVSLLVKFLGGSVVLYGCDTLSLTWEEHRLREFENRVLRRIVEPKRDKEM